jgi:transposase
MNIVDLGIDLGKNSCSLAGLDASGRVVLRRRLRRSSVEGFVTSLGRCTVAMEHVAVCIILAGHSPRPGTRCG